MSNVNNSPNMLLPVPQVGIEAGPQYATDVNSCLTIIDQHDHSPQHGVPVTPTGLNINADLSFASNNATNLRSSRYASQQSVLNGASDLDCVYVSGVDLYFNDGAGNKVRITESGGVAGTPGSISNLTSPASASYVAANETFVWQSAANTPANLDAASVILRNLVANSHGLTLNPPNSMSADYSITLPPLPASNLPVSIDNAGTMTAAQVTTAQIGNAQVTLAKLSTQVQNFFTAPTRTVLTSGSGTYTTPANVTYLKVRMVGGGGGGAGAGTGIVAGSNGTTTTFGTLSAGGGGAGSVNGGVGGNTSVVAGAIGIYGGGGQAGTQGQTNCPGGVGGSSAFGGAGASNALASGNFAQTNSGSGGAGGGYLSGGGISGGGGGAGGYLDALITSPAATYSYAVGAGGAGGSSGTNGGTGGSGIIIIEEHYGS